jgi:hypothetical protein
MDLQLKKLKAASAELGPNPKTEGRPERTALEGSG